MHNPKTITFIALTSLMLAASASVAAVTTKSFVLDDADSFFEGELDGTAVHSDGSVRTGAATSRIGLENVPLAYSLARRGNTTFVGTGTDGKVYRVTRSKVETFADTGELLVSSLSFGRDGSLYAGTLPKGRIYRIDPSSKEVALYSTPEGAEHIWALVYDKRRGQLIAATGPQGKVFAIDGIGRARELFKANAGHVMALAIDDKGSLLAGTSGPALLVRIAQNGVATVVQDLPGNEVTAIDVLDGHIAVAVNQFKTTPGTQFKAAAAAQGRPKGPPSPRPRAGSGEIWRIDEGGRTEKLIARQDTHFTAIQWGLDGAIYAGGGNEGRIFRIEADASYSIWADVEERQVLGLDLRSSSPSFITGDSAAFYRIEYGTPKDAVWTSASLDATFHSTWGRLTWRGEGRLVFQTRTGNTKEPGDTWSAWSKNLKRPGRIESPAGRFIQVRAKFPRDASAELRALELFYLPQNQRARVFHVQGGRPPMKRGESAAERPLPPTTLLHLSWKVDNPDGDPLRYRIAYREEGQPVWRDMLREDTVLREPKYTWDTNSIPDGFYVVRIEASDEEANPDDLALHSTAQSEPIRIDNHPPRIEALNVRRGRALGRVVDDLGPIARIQISIDAGPWRDVFPSDALLDEPDERFDVAIGSVGKGSHIIAVRAFDAAGNQANREITVKTK